MTMLKRTTCYLLSFLLLFTGITLALAEQSSLDNPYGDGDGIVEVGAVSATQGKQVSIPVYLRAEDTAIHQLSLALAYDQTQLEWVRVEGYNGTAATAGETTNEITVSSETALHNRFMTVVFEVLQDIPKGEIARVTPTLLTPAVNRDDPQQTYQLLCKHGGVIAPEQDLTFSIDTVAEADLVAVNVNLHQANSYVGAIQFDLDYDQEYLEIVKSPFNGKFLTVNNIENESGIWVSNDKTLMFAAATASGVKAAGSFITMYFRVIRDIPQGQVAAITAIQSLTPVSCVNGVTYHFTAIDGGVTGGEGIPGNKLFDQQSTGIQAVVPTDDPLQIADFMTQDLGQNTYDIKFEKDGEEKQPASNVVVRIPVPQEMNGRNCQVYRTEADGSRTDMLAAYHNGYLTFETNHFSQYTVSDQQLPSTPIQLPTATDANGLGDLNGDGKTDAADALLVLKAAVGKYTLTPNQTKAADVSGDAKVDATDALYILKKAVGKLTRFPAEES